MKDKAYYEDVNIKNELKLRDMIQKLPKFCMDFFIGIDADKSSRTKIAYAYDLQTFFEYMKSANPSLKKYDIRDYPISLLDQISPSDIEEYLFYLSIMRRMALYTPMTREALSESLHHCALFIIFISGKSL